MTVKEHRGSASKAPVAIWPEGTPKPMMPYSPAVKAGGWLFVAGQLASTFGPTGLPPEVKPDNAFLGDALELQSRFIMRSLKATLRAGGCDIAKDGVRVWQWFMSDYPTMEEFQSGISWPRISIAPYHRVRDEFILEPRPASTGMGIRKLLVRNALVEVDMICIDDDQTSISFPVPQGVPSPVAGYSPAIRRGDWIFLAGELPVDWVGDYLSPVHMGEPSALAKEARTNPYFWYGSPIETQTDYVLQKLEKIANVAGASLDRAVKAEVYIGHPSDFAGVDRVWKQWFPKNPPARVVIPYMALGGKGSRIEVALTLVAKESNLKIETIETAAAPKPLGHEPQAVKVGNFLFFSTQMAFDSNGKLADGMTRHPDYPYYGLPGKAQMRYMLKNVALICQQAGTKLENIVRRACFHDDGRWFAESIEEWAAHFPDLKPASTTVIIGGPLVVPGANTLLDLIAYIPD
jgi:enamine deaminase RidA (YjgF/YER057c/UK114 family)